MTSRSLKQDIEVSKALTDRKQKRSGFFSNLKILMESKLNKPDSSRSIALNTRPLSQSRQGNFEFD